MARRPVDIASSGEYPQDRQAIWNAIRKLHAEEPKGAFTKVDVASICKVNVSTVRTYLTGLTRAGFLEVVVDGTNTKDANGLAVRARWKLVRDVGVDAPRVTRDGKLVTQGSATEQLWKTMRILGDFTAEHLAITAGTPELIIDRQTADAYLYYLALAGYVKVTVKGKGKTPSQYRFIQPSFTGPKAPQIQRIKQVFDPNTGKVVWPISDGAPA